MMTRNDKNFAARAGFAMVLAMVVGCSSQMRSAEPAQAKGMTESTMREKCQDMKEQKRLMSEDMKAQDAALTEQLAEMNRAPKDKKVQLIAAVLTRSVEQRIAMDARMAKMKEKMMKHMIKHMQMGKKAMDQCPMMKDADTERVSS